MTEQAVNVKRFEFLPEHDGSLSLESAVHQAVGAASMCWENVERAGVFQEDRARLVAQALLDFIAVSDSKVTMDEGQR